MFKLLFLIFLVFRLQDANASLTEVEFNQAINKVISSYKPILDRKGIKLNLNKYFHNHTESSDTFVDEEDLNTWHINMRRGMSSFNGATKEMVMFVVCHELGHHLGGSPKHINHSSYGSSGNQWASVEGQADYWAINKCMRKVFLKDNNQKIVQKLKVPSLGKTMCAQVWKNNRVQKAICERLFHLAENSYFAKVKYASVFQVDSTVVSKTQGNHPEAQCRIDTMKAAALCTTPLSQDVSDIFLDRGVCMTGEGKRPACWFKEINSQVSSDSHKDDKLKRHIENDELEVIAKLIDRKKISSNHVLDNGVSILMYSIIKGSFRLAEYLFTRQDININWQDSKGRGAIHALTSKGIPYLMGVLLKRSDLNVNLQDNRGITALMAVAYGGDYRMYFHLIGDSRIDVEIKDKNNRDVSFYIQKGKANFKNEFMLLFQNRL